MHHYSPPVDQLLALGPPPDVLEWDDYGRFGFSPEDVPELVEMITDRDLNSITTPEPELWGPVHAWRALSQFQPETALDAMLEIHPVLFEDEMEEFLSEDLIDYCAKLGGRALPALERSLHDNTRGDSRIFLADAIGRVGKTHRELRDQCVAILTQELEAFEENSEELNGFIIGSLLDLKARESVSAMERAFTANLVDESIVGNWEDAQYELGLKERPREKRRPALPPEMEFLTTHRPEIPDRKKIRAKHKAERQARKKNRKKNRKK